MRPIHTLTLICCAAPLPAQSEYAVLLGKADDFASYNDVWGYTAPDGREYALIGTNTGTAIYNCVDPADPTLTGFISGPGSTWRDMKTYDQYAYVVTEGGGGMQIIDLRDPESPVLLRTWGSSLWGNAHNIAIDEASGQCWVVGTNNGARVMDLSGDPADPVHLGTYFTYVHDAHLQNGQGHMAEIYGGRFRILDIGNPPSFPSLDSIVTPREFTHAVWAGEDDQVAVTTDEVGGSPLGIYDISAPTNIRLLAEWTPDENSIPHNPVVHDGLVYCSWYTLGLIVADIGDPAEPKLWARYDTSPSYGGPAFHGAWGCYPLAPSGVVYVSDIEEGLNIIRVDGPPILIDHEPLPDTQDEVGPYPVVADLEARLGGVLTEVDVEYRVGGSGTQTVAMSSSGGTSWSGDLPGQASPAFVDYRIVAENDLGDQVLDPKTGWHTFFVGRIETVASYDFEAADDQGWTHGSVQGADDWERGAPAGRGGVSSGFTWQDPDTASSGSNCWANDLGSGTDGSYAPDVFDWLESPVIDVSGHENLELRFQHWNSWRNWVSDRAEIFVNGVSVWKNNSEADEEEWSEQVIDLSAFDGSGAVTLRWELETDGSIELGGWAIDDVELIAHDGTGGGATDTVLLTGTTSASVGETVSYTISNAEPTSPWTLLYGFNLNGSVLDGQEFDLGAPIFTAATGTTNLSGQASWTSAPLPANAAGRTIHVEARVDGPSGTADSNAVTLLVN